MTSTSSTTGARAHARAQAGAATLSAPACPTGVDPAQLSWAETVPPHGYTTTVLARGTRVRLADPDGGATAHLLLYRADAPWERLNVADTMKVPWQAYPRAGHPLLSDQGRLLATIVADSSGHHDLLCGPDEAGRRLLTLGIAKHGLDARDLAPSLALFTGVRVDPAGGALSFTGSAGPATAVDLLIHLPVLLVVANAAHPLDPDPALTALEVLAWRSDDRADVPRNDDPEYLRALFNTETTWRAAQ
ncbi:DUF1989 domain-containing protein [Mycobacterium sp. M1]|uniref:DUF1989 domain-containing protein n=1 Tax=Mycolicibacter acidiphilus TaxID=2835306 RepID=A0ABS5RPI5_9MYCO|nr:DUF1989 domain-containing protein [Mycolicibacter acidiphilus]MBS9536126.1 DUF1989 domain-containing protein [Mycolicibacter acidiphilus]